MLQVVSKFLKFLNSVACANNTQNTTDSEAGAVSVMTCVNVNVDL